MKYTATSLNKMESKELVPGFHGKFIHTDDMTIAYWRIEKGGELPAHSHHNKQIVQLVSGEFAMTIGGEKHIYTEGQFVEIPGNVEHSGKALTDCVIHDIFLPAREDLK